MVSGYPDEGFEKFTGYKFKDLPSNVAWARRIADAGMTPVTYVARDPIAVLQQLEPPIGIWAASGNAPLALSFLRNDSPVRIACAALLFPFTLDLDGATHVANAASTYHFANPGGSIDELRTDVPLFLVRAGRDEFPGLNETLDRFVLHALHRNLPVTVVNHPTGAHAFDVHDDGDATRAIIAQTIAFLRSHGS